MQGTSNVNKHHVPCITLFDTKSLKILLVHPEYTSKGCKINIMFLSIKSFFFFFSHQGCKLSIDYCLDFTDYFMLKLCLFAWIVIL